MDVLVKKSATSSSPSPNTAPLAPSAPPCSSAVLTTKASTSTRPTLGTYQSFRAGAIGSGRNTVIEFFEQKWKEGLTLNAAMKLGLEALQHANDSNLNRSVRSRPSRQTATTCWTGPRSTANRPAQAHRRVKR